MVLSGAASATVGAVPISANYVPGVSSGNFGCSSVSGTVAAMVAVVIMPVVFVVPVLACVSLLSLLVSDVA